MRQNASPSSTPRIPPRPPCSTSCACPRSASFVLGLRSGSDSDSDFYSDPSLKHRLALFPNAPWPEPPASRAIRQPSTLGEALTPLAKPDDGGVRPIAVGEPLYGLCAKVLLRHYFGPDFLLPCQLGVGSKGGVEPVVHVVERALDKTLPQSYTHLVSLNFANAFNTVSRVDLAAGLRDYAPALYRAGRWIYGQPTPLAVTGADGQLELIPSAQGVRQGDPFGPLFFSLAVRQVVDHLVTRLGPGRLLAGYLDDMYVLSSDDHTLDDVSRIMDEQACPIRPSASDPAQRLQQDLRHLQRSLRIDDLPACWDELDHGLCSSLLALRGSPRRLNTDTDLVTLPARLGGLGILSHSKCSPHAFAATPEAADLALAPLLGPLLGMSAVGTAEAVPQRILSGSAAPPPSGPASRLSSLASRPTSRTRSSKPRSRSPSAGCPPCRSLPHSRSPTPRSLPVSTFAPSAPAGTPSASTAVRQTRSVTTTPATDGPRGGWPDTSRSSGSSPRPLRPLPVSPSRSSLPCPEQGCGPTFA